MAPEQQRRQLQVRLDAPLPLNDLAAASASPFSTLAKFVCVMERLTSVAGCSTGSDPDGTLRFAGKASLDKHGVAFSSGSVYHISMDQLSPRRIVGVGQYGVVQLVRHLPSGVDMAIKEIRLQLDETKMSQIIMELQILHSSHCPHIIDFYGAFFIESCVYMCVEFMDGGSLDKLCGGGIEESVLVQIALAVVRGLSFLKTEMSIMHRDVKPTNILVNSSGQIKLCDFGVSGQLVQSLAKTNVGCQPYMAPERITSRDSSRYSSKSDIWSLGISLVELGSGKYPFPPSIYDSILAQLNVIVCGESPNLPEDGFSADAREFIAACLEKDPDQRPPYSQLQQMQWLAGTEPDAIVVGEWDSTLRHISGATMLGLLLAQVMALAKTLMVAILRLGPIPRHVAFVMDGNRRFARRRSLSTGDGHKLGSKQLLETLDWCLKLGISVVTVYAFSIENFKRPKEEVDLLMKLAEENFRDFVDRRILGRKELLPPSVRQAACRSMVQTRQNKNAVLNICCPYTSQDEMMVAVKDVICGVREGWIRDSDISVDLVERCLLTEESPPVDILVRTSGEARLSDFLLWQVARDCSVCFLDKFWPEFSFWDMLPILLRYQAGFARQQISRIEARARSSQMVDLPARCLRKGSTSSSDGSSAPGDASDTSSDAAPRPARLLSRTPEQDDYDDSEPAEQQKRLDAFCAHVYAARMKETEVGAQ
eukprot:jgi/Hompol1/350/HPOL_002475-RA